MKKPFSFKVLTKSGGLARTGVIHTPHGDIETPTFVVVGTHAEVKCLTSDDLRDIGVQAMLSNGYHLLRRAVMIDAAGGLAKFNGWHGPTMTDSGGFQVMSLGSGLGKIVSMDQKDIAIAEREARKSERLALVDDDGVEFRNPWNGRIVKFTPEMSVRTQHQIGADMMMAFDELTNISDSYEYNVEALERTRKWAERSLAEHVKQTNLRVERPYQALFGVLQGAHYQDLREKAARDLANMRINGAEFDGFGLGGAFEKERLGEIIAYMTRILPENKPRHLLGLSKPDDIFVGVENGCDTFDCVAPTREARHGRVYTLDGDINLRRAEFESDEKTLDPECDCPVCTAGYTRAKLRSLLKSSEPEEKARALTMLSGHNVRFIIRLTEQIRAAISSEDFDELKKYWLKRYYHGTIKT
ncbi:MAG: tRNA guanosine(34) transglycosylase Tgt [Candidatus Nomurabacteria bacterium]|jgi:queuine tRNA-ribosyltransferase|nr:tRNA guanosine(34) transglycosylase Tgt [Candidatus Nomurabacteria bacterium]